MGLTLARWMGQQKVDLMLLSRSSTPEMSSRHFCYLLGSKTRITEYSLDISILDTITRQTSIANLARGDSATSFHLGCSGIYGPTSNIC
jgi:hypothetical protein